MENSKKTRLFNNILSVVLGVLCVVWLYPVILIFFNSFKSSGVRSPSKSSLVRNPLISSSVR